MDLLFLETGTSCQDSGQSIIDRRNIVSILYWSHRSADLLTGKQW
jgi:hypothetical protein